MPYLNTLSKPHPSVSGSSEESATGITCPICPRSFSGRNKKQNLEYHIMTHTGAKPFRCPHCSHRSNRMSNLKLHISTQHSTWKQQQDQILSNAIDTSAASTHHSVWEQQQVDHTAASSVDAVPALSSEQPAREHTPSSANEDVVPKPSP